MHPNPRVKDPCAALQPCTYNHVKDDNLLSLHDDLLRKPSFKHFKKRATNKISLELSEWDP